MHPDGRRIGAHLPLGHGMIKAVNRAHEIGLDALQVFSDNPTAWRRRSEPPHELATFRDRIAELGIGPIAIHAAYLVNLAGSDPDLVERSATLLASELRVAPSFGARFVNVHVGSHRGSDPATGTARLADGVARVLAEVDEASDAATLVLENSAGAGDDLGSTVDDLAGILDAITARGVPDRRVALCLDTAHLWGAGYRISDPAEVDRLLGELDRRIGLGRLAMIHFNDSRAALGSHLDRHDHVAAGSIGPAGMAALLNDPRLGAVVYYLETPGMDQGYDALNAARVRDLAAGRALTKLPPDAGTVGRSRTRTHPPAGPSSPDEPATDSRGRPRRAR